MQIIPALFYIFSAITVCSAFFVVMMRNPVHSVLFLILTFFSAAGIWMLMYAEFLAITLILIYVGAVMVLFLFVVMMLKIPPGDTQVGFWKRLPMALFAGGVVLSQLFFFIRYYFSRELQEPLPEVEFVSNNTASLGRALFTEYVLPFEIAGVLLLVAIVAAIALTLGGKKRAQAIDPSVAVHTVANDRIRLIQDVTEKT